MTSFIRGKVINRNAADTTILIPPDYKLTELLDNESFVRWVKDEASSEEQRLWEKWEQQDSIHIMMKQRARLLYRLPLEVMNGADVEQQLAHLKAMIGRQSKRVYSSDISEKRKKKYYWVAAAIVLFLVTVGVLAIYQKQLSVKNKTPLYTSIEVGYGEKGVLKISDGSSVRLNANSTLRYSPEQFNRSKVEVWLKGEAYFSITRNPEGKKRRFIVHTPDGDVQVLGTRFNVNTRFRQTSVVLEKGKIQVILGDSLHKARAEKIMKPGERALLASSLDTIPLQQVNTNLYTAWLHGKLVFKETPLNEIIQIIEATYGIDVSVKESDLLDEKITGSLRNPDLQTLLKGLKKTLQVDITQKIKGKFLISRRQQSSQNE